MKRIAQGTLLFIMVALAGFGATLLAARATQMSQLLTEEPSAVAAGSVSELETGVSTLSAPAASEPAVEAQAAAREALSAVGTVEVKEDRQVVLGAGGRVDAIHVEVGDPVKAGAPLIALDTTHLDWAVEQAEIGFETARINFEELGDLIEEADIQAAEANLLLAQETLTEVERGPSDEELASAKSAAAAAWSRYEELQKKPTPAQINSALATLRKAEITLQQAQREYDKIAWLPEAAASAAADDLQRATVDLEAAKAAFEEANKPAEESELQSALSAAQAAQDNLNRLSEKPTPAELAAAQADVVSAQTALDKLKKGPKESELRKAELNVRQAMIGLEQARLDREHADVVAPIDGTVLSVNVELGQQASAGTVAATLADTANVRLVVNVEQKDISRIYPGQFVDISVFALPDEQFAGIVDRVAPIANAGTGFVTFPVIIVLTDGPMEMLLPGMTASAVFQEGEAPTADEPATDESAADEPATDEPASEPTDEEAVDEPAETGESAPEADESAEEADTEPDAETAAPDASGD
ncbi:MAG: efflux RND transporter periplasmic adaptor subunit [Chloroflexota bacterium]|jgi:multidrug resistance efflux pump|nr:efflux RND transporter periplasmic adaptor subunit [Chloroflexota bacterium]